MTTRVRLKGAGLNPTEVKEIWGAKAFYIFDPEGNRIEFWSGEARS
jgi:catechol-2,3-dioxygenase